MKVGIGKEKRSMLSKYRFLALAIGLTLAFATAVAGVGVSDVVGQVSQTYYTHVLNDLLYTHTGDNRGGGTATNVQAAANIYAQFQSFGLQTFYDPFINGGTTYNNVVGVLPGLTRPNDIYIVGAHFDSVNNPGADDNASGTAGVIEAARVLSQYQFEATIIFIGFNLEEWGLIGSSAYAAKHASDNILGMISLDMIAYNPTGSGYNSANIYGRSTSDPLKNALADALWMYGGLTSYIGGAIDASDHAPFEWQGKQACLLIEANVWSNPYYHQQTDSVDTPNYIDYAYATNMVRGTVGYLANAAVLIPEPGSITVLFGGTLWLAVCIRRRKIQK